MVAQYLYGSSWKSEVESGMLSLVLAPTRELVQQIHKEVRTLFSDSLASAIRIRFDFAHIRAIF